MKAAASDAGDTTPQTESTIDVGSARKTEPSLTPRTLSDSLETSCMPPETSGRANGPATSAPDATAAVGENEARHAMPPSSSSACTAFSKRCNDFSTFINSKFDLRSVRQTEPADPPGDTRSKDNKRWEEENRQKKPVRKKRSNTNTPDGSAKWSKQTPRYTDVNTNRCMPYIPQQGLVATTSNDAKFPIPAQGGNGAAAAVPAAIDSRVGIPGCFVIGSQIHTDITASRIATNGALHQRLMNQSAALTSSTTTSLTSNTGSSALNDRPLIALGAYRDGVCYGGSRDAGNTAVRRNPSRTARQNRNEDDAFVDFGSDGTDTDSDKDDDEGFAEEIRCDADVALTNSRNGGDVQQRRRPHGGRRANGVRNMVGQRGPLGHSSTLFPGAVPPSAVASHPTRTPAIVVQTGAPVVDVHSPTFQHIMDNSNLSPSILELNFWMDTPSAFGLDPEESLPPPPRDDIKMHGDETTKAPTESYDMQRPRADDAQQQSHAPSNNPHHQKRLRGGQEHHGIDNANRRQTPPPLSLGAAASHELQTVAADHLDSPGIMAPKPPPIHVPEDAMPVLPSVLAPFQDTPVVQSMLELPDDVSKGLSAMVSPSLHPLSPSQHLFSGMLSPML